METDNKLNELVEQAACCVTMLNPTDLSDVQALQEVLRQIGAAAGSLDRAPIDLRKQLETTTTQTGEVLQDLLQQDVEDTAQAMETVSQAICVLQGLIGRLADPVTGPVPMPSEPPAVPQTPPSASTDPGAMTISEEDAPLVLDFITESNEHVETAESALLELENHPDNGELINKIFRGFHTIKGMAGFLNLAEIQSLAHSSESLLDLARKNQLVLVGDTSDVVFEAIDGLKKMLAALKNAVESGQPVVAHEPLPNLLEKLKAAAEGTRPKAEDRGQKTEDSAVVHPPSSILRRPSSRIHPPVRRPSPKPRRTTENSKRFSKTRRILRRRPPAPRPLTRRTTRSRSAPFGWTTWSTWRGSW
jgi:HPt (histidine-containing phosphotransfer) domain-containing protein